MPSRPSQPEPNRPAAYTVATVAAARTWDNPIPSGRYDLVVLGGDRAARWAAHEAASFGARVAWLVGERDGDPVADRDAPPIDVYLGAAHFIAPDALHLAGRQLHFVRALIAVPATAFRSGIEGLDDVPWTLSAHDIVGRALDGPPPDRVAIVGAGAAGCAAAQTLGRAAARTKITLFERAERILPREVPEAAALVAALLDERRVHVRVGGRVVAVRDADRGRLVHTVAADGAVAGEQADGPHGPDSGFDVVIDATGRRCDHRALDLAAAGVELDGGRLRLDTRLRTTNPRIYAAGDAALDHPSPHGAMATAGVALPNALFDGRRRADILTIPRIVRTNPPIASAGLLPHEPDAADVPLDTLVWRGAASEPRADVSKGHDVAGYVALHLAAGTDVLLGATLVGPDAAAAIGEVAHAIDAGVRLAELGRAIRPAGAFADGLTALADDARRRRRSPGVRELGIRWLALRRTWADRAASGG